MFYLLAWFLIGLCAGYLFGKTRAVMRGDRRRFATRHVRSRDCEEHGND